MEGIDLLDAGSTPKGSFERGVVIGSVEFTVGNILKPWDADPEEYLITVEGKIAVLVDDDDDVPAGQDGTRAD